MEINSSIGWYYFSRRAEIFACSQFLWMCQQNHETVKACWGVCGSGVGGAGSGCEGLGGGA